MNKEEEWIFDERTRQILANACQSVCLPCDMGIWISSLTHKDLPTRSDEALISGIELERFWAVDYLFRLRIPDALARRIDRTYVQPLPEDLPETVDLRWMKEFERADEEIRSASSPMYYADLLMFTGSYAPAVVLSSLREGLRLSWAEFWQRMDRRNLRIGPNFLSYLYTESPDGAEPLLKILRSGIEGWYRKARIPVAAKVQYSWLRKGLKLPTSLAGRNPKAEEILGSALLAVHELYDQLRKLSDQGLPKDRLFFPWKNPNRMVQLDWGPASNPHWDTVAPKMFERLSRYMRAAYLPILAGEMERAPLEVIDAHRTRFRQEHKWETNFEVRLEDLSEDDPNKKLLSKLEYRHWKKQRFEEEEAEAERSLGERFIGMLNEKVKGAKKAQQVREALMLIFLEGKSETEAARITGITDKTIRNWKLKLGLDRETIKGRQIQ